VFAARVCPRGQRPRCPVGDEGDHRQQPGRQDDFVDHFAGDVEPMRARVLYAVQQALASSAFTDVMGVPAWKSLASWYLVAQDDEAIPPDAERLFASRMGATTVEVPSSHVAMVSHPQEVTDLIEKAAQAVGKGAVV
jgi:Alpha/beta hydrolase family